MRSRHESMLIQVARCSFALVVMSSGVLGGNANRLTYLDDPHPYYPHRDFPKLTTPQWVGEAGVEAVVILAIDDMSSATRYETYLRPILDRLKQIDGRAPVSIMTTTIDPRHHQLQAWLREGLSIEAHTLTHPCPLLTKGDIEEARRTYHACVDQLASIPGNKPVAFRMPCCDSLNTPSPRFFSEIFAERSPGGHSLSIDSSVFCVLTADDPELPRELVEDADGRERFRKYLPFPSFVNTIENYPYPYLINNVCWEFPCVVPSDWEGQNLHKSNNPKTQEDLKAALDAIVIKQGVMNLVFHPHGWIENSQINELIQHAQEKHGGKVKFLTFKEALERLNRYLLLGQAVRDEKGLDAGARLLDLNEDGYLDLILSGERGVPQTRLWNASTRDWTASPFPSRLAVNAGARNEFRARFGILGAEHHLVMIEYSTGVGPHAWEFDGHRWVLRDEWLQGLDLRRGGNTISALRLRDLNADGKCEAILAARGSSTSRVLGWSDERASWYELPFKLPLGAFTSGFDGLDSGTRFVDLDEDGFDDVVFSHDISFGVHLFEDMAHGWSRRALGGKAGEAEALPLIARGPQGENNGFWVHSRQLWWQNEDTAELPDLVDRRSFNDLLRKLEPRAKSPEASLRSLRVKPGFRVELMAAEPLVRDPIAFDWDEHGRLWVVEMGDYPLGGDGAGSPDGRVRFVEDIDGDGRLDRSTVFLEGLPFPTGVLPWRDGVIISAAPEIFLARDTDGDGRADRREVLLTGFSPGNPQHRVNGLELGLDGWVHGANGDSGGVITSTKSGRRIEINGRDFRFRPDSGELEPESGQTQYGRHRDDWGQWFGGNNSVWGWHYVLSDSDLARNPRVAPPRPSQILQADTLLRPISPTAARFNDFHMANRVTSANSTTPYRDELLGPALAGSLFVSEPVHNLVGRLALDADGPTFRARRVLELDHGEFLASSDPWFRPTMIRTGPDGGLWVADMHRAVIEHPEWIPDEWEARIDLRAGSELGRLYRVLPVGVKPRTPPVLAGATTLGLVDALESPNGWTRDTAQRMLLHRNDPAALGLLRDSVRAAARPESRAQALWTLADLGGLDAETANIALSDPDPRARAQAARASRPLLSSDPRFGVAIARLADDGDPRPRFEAALALGDWADPRAAEALARIARKDAADPWIRAALLSSARPHAGAILTSLLSDQQATVPDLLLGPLFASLVDAEGGVAPLLAIVTQPDAGAFRSWQFRALAELLDAADRAEKPIEEWVEPDPALRAECAARVAACLEAARGTTLSADAATEARLAAIPLLARVDEQGPADRVALASLLKPNEAPEIQSAALQALERTGSTDVPDLLLMEWSEHGPLLRSSILGTLLSRPSWTVRLLDGLESGALPPRELDSTARQALFGLGDTGLSERAAKLFGRLADSRADVLARYRPDLERPPLVEEGRAMFVKSCAPCHRLGDVGHEVGPDLAALADRSSEALLVAILDPNRAFESKFAAYNIATRDGRVFNGLIAAETSAGVTLRRQDGKEDVLLRAEIDEMRASGQSLMPEGLERDLTPAQVRDLIAYLQELGPAPKQLEGNRPALVAAGSDGTITLAATTAEIRGDSLTFETKHQNLGYWSSETDRATWRFEVPRAGTYEVWIKWACPAGSEGNHLVVDLGARSFDHAVGSTGTWDDYEIARIGEVPLPAGRARLELRSRGPIQHGAMLDLERIELRPVAPPGGVR